MRGALVLAVLLAVVAGCSASRVDQPGPAPTPSRGAAAPTVGMPLSTAPFAMRPCDLLTTQDIAELGLSGSGQQRQTIGAAECRWKARAGEDLGLTPDDRRNLLEDAYRSPGRGVSAPGDVLGFPSLRRKTGSGDLNICTVIVGLGPVASLTANWVGTGAPGGERDACSMAEQAVALAIRKLPPA
jgi:hypothetical protein